MKKSTLDLLKVVTEEDLLTLTHLYLYRAMDVEQLMKYVYKVDTSITSGKTKRTKIRKRLTDNGLVTTSIYQRDKEALQITNKGIELVRYVKELPKEVLDFDTKATKRGYYTAADLNLSTRFINHQVHLNQFMLEFGERARDIGLPWNYYDEKFLSQYHGIRPDGLISILDHDIFLEIDMATESEKQLVDKWEHYRAFLNSGEFRYKSRKIVVLFDIEGIVSKNKIKNRIELVKKTIVNTILDQVTDDFDIIIKPRAELLSYIFESLIPKILNRHPHENAILRYLVEQNWQISYGYNLNPVLLGDFYNYFARKMDSEGNILKYAGTLQEYFVDFYLDQSLSVLHRIEFYKRNTALYKKKFGRDIRLIIVTDNIETIYEDLTLLGQKVLGQPNIYFLDINKFDSKLEIYQNLYALGLQGEVYKVTTRDHSRREFKYKIGEKSPKNKKGRIVEVRKK